MKPIKPKLKAFGHLLKGAVVENVGYKFASLFITFIIFFYGVGEQHIDVSKILPVEYILSNQLVIGNDVPPTIEIHVSGPRAAIQEFLPRTDVIKLDLTQARPGYSSYRVHSDMIRLPRALKVTSISPSIVTPKLELREFKMVKVKPILDGDLPEGFELVEVTTIPAEVELTGPQSLVEQTESVKTLVIDISKLSGSLEQEVELEANGEGKLSSQPNVVKVYLRVQELFELKVFQEVPVEVQTSNRFLAKPHTVRVTVRIPKNLASAIQLNQIKARVNLSHRESAGEFEEEVDLELPPNVTLLLVEPEKIKITLFE